MDDIHGRIDRGDRVASVCSGVEQERLSADLVLVEIMELHDNLIVARVAVSHLEGEVLHGSIGQLNIVVLCDICDAVILGIHSVELFV